MKILIIEDNRKTVDYLEKGLRENFFIVDTAYDGQEGFFLLKENTYDLVILDVMLPHLDGWDLIQYI